MTTRGPKLRYNPSRNNWQRWDRHTSSPSSNWLRLETTRRSTANWTMRWWKACKPIKWAWAPSRISPSISKGSSDARAASTSRKSWNHTAWGSTAQSREGLRKSLETYQSCRSKTVGRAEWRQAESQTTSITTHANIAQRLNAKPQNNSKCLSRQSQTTNSAWPTEISLLPRLEKWRRWSATCRKRMIFWRKNSTDTGNACRNNNREMITTVERGWDAHRCSQITNPAEWCRKSVISSTTSPAKNSKRTKENPELSRPTTTPLSSP